MSTIENNLIERPPVVVIMGHIDHGKSTLLDHIRNSNIVSKEAGGITQHLGAYEVHHKDESGNDKKITFLDTPGHEAFCGVRSRGAKVADIAILMVSAEDGVMPQTLEALKCIHSDKMPFVVAINKIDSPKANIEKAKASLVENEIYIEGNGGEIPVVEISAKEGTNIDDLLTMLLLVAEVEEYKADSAVKASGFVVEAHKDNRKGISATLVVKGGSMKSGQFVACQGSYSPVRIFEDTNGNPIKEASFSTPVQISGWSDFPVVGDEFQTFDSKKEAEKYCKEAKEILGQDKKSITLNDEVFTIPIIVKADTHGSIEAIEHEFEKIKLNSAEIQIVHAATGNITETDIKIASGNEHSIVVGFGIDIERQAGIMKDRLNVKIETFKIIYELTDWVAKTAEEIRPLVESEELIGSAKILKTFSATNKVKVAGGRVEVGQIKLGSEVKIVRRDEEIGTGKVKELQMQKSKATEVPEGTEFGMSIETKVDIAGGDVIQVFETVKK